MLRISADLPFTLISFAAQRGLVAIITSPLFRNAGIARLQAIRCDLVVLMALKGLAAHAVVVIDGNNVVFSPAGG